MSGDKVIVDDGDKWTESTCRRVESSVQLMEGKRAKT